MESVIVEQRERRPRRRSAARVIGVLIALVIGGGGGAIAGAALAETPLAGSLGGGPAAPTQPPELPADFPDVESHSPYLPDVTVSAVRTWAEDKDYECEDLTQTAGFDVSPRGAVHWVQCHLPRSFGSARAEVEVEHNGEAEVVAVHVTCERGAATSDDFCPSLARRVTRTVFAGQRGVRKKAATWAAGNIQNDATTVIGGMQLTVDLGAHRLTIVPADG